MPARPKTTDERVTDSALAILEREGIARVTMARVATAAGVRAPSLYKRFPDRAALLGRVRLQVLRDLERLMATTASSLDPGASLEAMGEAYRFFALRRPHAYLLLYAPGVTEHPETAPARLAAVRPLFDALRALGVDDPHLLPASRSLVAFVHGYVTMEIAGAFHMAKPDASHFRFGLRALLASLRSRP